MDLKKAEAVSMFSKTKLKQDLIDVGNRLALQAVSWTPLNQRKVFSKIIEQGNFYRNDSIIETLLKFTSFLNVFLHRLSQITMSVKIIQPLLSNFHSIRKMLTLSPQNRSENQNKTIDEKIRSLQNQILAEAKSLHTLQMDKKFNHIIPFFTSNCDNVNFSPKLQ